MIRLSIADLDAFDPNGRGGRYCCPLCHGDRPRRAQGRTLSLRRDNGLWKCHRCEAKGILTDFTTEPGGGTHDNRQLIARSPLPSIPEPKRYDFDSEVRKARPLADTIGAAYIGSRGISVDVAHAAGVRFANGFLGRPAVLFPLRDEKGRLVAAQGRVARSGDGWKRTIKRGDADHSGVFSTADAFDSPAAVIAEAPIDALSLATCGVPAFGLVGVASCPEWLLRRVAFERVFLAFDADEAGDRKAAELGLRMSKQFETRVYRLRPDSGAKDWNDALRAHGEGALGDALGRRLRAILGKWG